MAPSRRAILFFLTSFAASTLALGQDIEIVETIPVGTALENPDIRDAKDVWVAMIDRAERTLDLEQFYVSNAPGSAMERVLLAIQRAATRGVRVRLLVDARMYKTYPETVDSLGRKPNIETRRLDFSTAGGGIQHAKYFIVDGSEVFVGSQNFDWRALEHIHELGLRVKSSAFARAYQDVFELDWDLAGGGDARFDGSRVIPHISCAVNTGDTALIRPTFSPRGWIPDSLLWDERAILGVIDGARSGLVLQFLAYGTHERKGGPYTVIDDAIRRAARRGVKVRMIVSDWMKGSASEADVKSLSKEPNVEVAFTCIPEWAGGYIPFARVEHCKFIVADTTGFWLGTSNCEKGYFYGSRNLGIVGANRTLAQRLAAIFEKSWQSPYKESVVDGTVYPPRVHGERAP
ncbi:MAG: phospholipase [Ignavibacteriae bacterium]|nr:phospholipase [Ignavibacteriota bacterium]